MDDYRLMWLLLYAPCHDHEMPSPSGPHTQYDYWTVGGLALMHSEIRLP